MRIAAAILFMLMSCTTGKRSETTEPASAAAENEAIDTTSSVKPTVASAVNQTQPELLPADTVDAIVNIQENYTSRELALNPFESLPYEMAENLRARSVDVYFKDGEFGQLSFDSCSINFAQAYGLSICNMDVRSSQISMTKNIRIGMNKQDFFKTIEMISGNNEGNERRIRYQFEFLANEQTYRYKFDFNADKLFRIQLTTDPCVIYD